MSEGEPTAMPGLTELIQEYCELLNAERLLNERKDQLRQEILSAMAGQGVDQFQSPVGSARRTSYFKLNPRRDAVLNLLSAEDLFDFAHFTPARVRNILVPKYGRQTLLPLFDYQKSETLYVRRPGSAERSLGDGGP
jgi:hypothetical protein